MHITDAVAMYIKGVAVPESSNLGDHDVGHECLLAYDWKSTGSLLAAWTRSARDSVMGRKDVISAAATALVELDVGVGTSCGQDPDS